MTNSVDVADEIIHILNVPYLRSTSLLKRFLVSNWIGVIRISLSVQFWRLFFLLIEPTSFIYRNWNTRIQLGMFQQQEVFYDWEWENKIFVRKNRGACVDVVLWNNSGIIFIGILYNNEIIHIFFNSELFSYRWHRFFISTFFSHQRL